MKKRIISTFLCAALIALNVNIINSAAQDYDFSDVSQAHWAYNTINELSSSGVISGFDDNTFRPDDNVTREQFIKLLVCAVDNVEADAQTYNIEDITTDDWSYVYLANADETGIIDSDDYADGFNPRGVMDRATAVKWINNGIGISQSAAKTEIFSDITQEKTKAYASKLYECGIIQGYDDGKFHPDGSLTRAEAATIIKNITVYLDKWEIPDEDREIVEYADGVLKLEASRKTNILSANSEKYCEFTNIDDSIKALKTGSIVVVPNCEKAPGGMAVRVKNISIKNQTAVITKDNNLALEDIVDKIDINKKSALTAANVVKDNLPDGVVITDNSSYAMSNMSGFNYNALTASVDDAEVFFDPEAKKGGFKVTFTKEIEPRKGISIKGSVDIDGTVHADMQYGGQIIKKPDISVDLDINALPELTVKASGKTNDVTILEIPSEIPFEAGTIFLTIILKVNASGEVYATASCGLHHSGSLQYRPTQGLDVPVYKNKVFRATPDIKMEMSGTVTPKIVFRTGIAFLGLNDDNSVASAFIDPEVGLNVKAAINSKLQTHIHKPCIDISVTPYVAVGAGLGLMGVDIKNWEDIWSHEFNAYKCYVGFADKWEYGKGRCPYAINTYTTQYNTLQNNPTYECAFDYPSGWTVTKDEIYKKKSGKPSSGLYENFVISNDRGVTVSFMRFANGFGSSGKTITRYTASKAASCKFDGGFDLVGSDRINHKDYLGEFMVGEIKAVAYYDYLMKTEDFEPLENGAVSYAVMPESYAGTHEASGLSDLYKKFSTQYTPYLLIAEAPDGVFTEKEKREVIKMLSSFRTVDVKLPWQN